MLNKNLSETTKEREGRTAGKEKKGEKDRKCWIEVGTMIYLTLLFLNVILLLIIKQSYKCALQKSMIIMRCDLKICLSIKEQISYKAFLFPEETRPWLME